MNTTLEKLINKKDFCYVNGDLTIANFPAPEKIQTEGWKIIKLNKGVPSEEALAEIKAQGCRPANVYELVTWVNSHKEEIEKGTWLVALGQTAKIDYHRVPHVYRYSGGDFRFDLGYFGNDWHDDYYLLCFCDESTQPLTTLETSPLTLEQMIGKVVMAGFTVTPIDGKVMK